MSVTLFVKHPVNDYAKWKSGYVSLVEKRKEWGVQGASVHQEAGDPNMVIVTHKFADLDTAQTFIGADELKKFMQELGVSAPPEVWMTEDVEETPY